MINLLFYFYIFPTNFANIPTMRKSLLLKKLIILESRTSKYDEHSPQGPKYETS